MSLQLTPEEKERIATDIVAMKRVLANNRVTSVMKQCTPQGVAMAFALAAIGPVVATNGSREDYMNLVTAAWDIASGGSIPPRLD
jgi:hypothetical protein